MKKEQRMWDDEPETGTPGPTDPNPEPVDDAPGHPEKPTGG